MNSRHGVTTESRGVTIQWLVVAPDASATRKVIEGSHGGKVAVIQRNVSRIGVVLAVYCAELSLSLCLSLCLLLPARVRIIVKNLKQE